MNRSSSCLFGQLLPWLLLLCWNFSGFARAENLEQMFIDHFKGANSENLAEKLSNTCNQTYGLKAAETFKVEFNKSIPCVWQAIEDNPQYVRLVLSTIFGPRNPENENLTFSVLVNEVLPPIRNKCITPLIPALKGCTDLDGHRNIATLESLIDFFTEDGGRHIYDYFIDESGSQCVDQYKENIIACFDRLPDMLSQVQSNVSIFTKKNCRSLDEQSDCAIRTIQQGCSIATVNLLKGAKDVIMKGTDCSTKLGNHKDSDLGHNSILINCLITQRIEKRHLQKK